MCHRALMMASAWERNRYHSQVEKAAAFLPSLIAEDYLKIISPVQAVQGVLLFADISGGVSREEQPRTRAFLGHARPFGALPRLLRQSGPLVTAEAFCWDAPREGDGLCWAVNHCHHQH